MEKRRSEPPDGGYGWVVVTSAFFIMGLTAGVHKNFGLFFLEIQNHYNVLSSTTSWVSSTSIALFHLGAPLASYLILRLSHRVVIMLGGILGAFGMVVGSFGLRLPWLYLSVGVIQGLGLSFCWLPANSIVSHYFRRWRPIAYAIASSGECVFAMVFSPFFQWLIEIYSWQGCLLIIGALQLNLCVCGALMRPLQSTHTSTTGEPMLDSKEEPRISKSATFQWSLIRRPELLLYILFAILTTAGFFVPPLFLVPYTKHLGMEQYWAAAILSVVALTDLLGRLGCGWLANLRLLRNLQLLTLVATALGVVLLLLPIAQCYWSILVFSSLYGFLFGCVVAIHVTSIVDIVGIECFDSALGLYMLFRSSGGFLSPPAAGWLVDWFQDYSAAFYFAGICLVVSGAFVVLVDWLVEKKKRKNPDSGSGSKIAERLGRRDDCTDV